MTYIPLCNMTHYTFQTGYSKVDTLVKRCASYGIPAISVTDNIMSGAIKLSLECEKNGIKPIFGLSVSLGKLLFLVYAKNYNGYINLISLSNKANIGDILVSDILSLNDVIVVSKDVSDYCGSLADIINKFRDDFYCGVTAVNRSDVELYNIRDFATKHKIKPVALNETLYTDKSERDNHLTLLCSSYKTTYQEINEHAHLNRAILNDRFYLEPSETFNVNTDEELKNSIEISDKCEKFQILGELSLPSFGVDNEQEYLRSLCIDGWNRKIKNVVPQSEISTYVDRIRHELDVINRCGLSGYFLIVQDYINWAKNNDILVGPGRGSSAGSLISYLTNITEVDPIKYGLLFERFYNEGRNAPGRIATPDIDADFQPSRRAEVMNYIRDKYSREKVCQVATFGSLKGRGALKEVFRIHNVCDEKTSNEITKNLPQEGAISDKLEEDKETSIIRWTLNNSPKSLESWCKIENGEYTGCMAEHFKQAIEIEGTYKSYGKHASALVLSNYKISDRYQMLKDKSGHEMLLGIEYEDAEKSGLIKADILGLSTLDKLMKVKKLLKFGKY